MGPIVLLEGEELQAFLSMLAVCGDVSQLRIAIDESDGGIKIKPERHAWSRPIGEIRPH